MNYEEIELLKQSEKSTVYLVREEDGEKVFVRKKLKGQHPVYLTLINCKHPYLPDIYEVTMEDGYTTVIEEYVEGQSLGCAELSEKQLTGAAKELCSVLEFLHEKDIIHRDIKPSNIIMAKDGHIRLIDFDAARMPKDDLEQDTRLLGTRGYAPPEQYGFSQTDARADIYALGVTLKQLLGDKSNKRPYKRIIQKCTNLNPDKRYQSAGQVKKAISYGKRGIWYGLAALILIVILGLGILSESEKLPVLPAPDAPHWDGETGVAVWGNVPESGNEREVRYKWRLYRCDTNTPPDLEKSTWYREGNMGGNGANKDKDFPIYEMNLASYLAENGFYYFAVSATGDGVHYADSPYVISDAFEYTGEEAVPLPAPTGLEWKVIESNQKPQYYATWSNLDDYEDADSFNVCVYNESGDFVVNNVWSKEQIMYLGHDGIWINPEFLKEDDGAYRFTVEVYTSRPNEYQSYFVPEPIPEECFSPWYNR